MSDTDYCYECDRVTEWHDETCTGCSRTWGHPLGEGGVMTTAPSVQTALVTDEHHLAVEVSLPHLPGAPTVCISQDEAVALAEELLAHADADPAEVLEADHGDRLIDSWKDQ